MALKAVSAPLGSPVGGSGTSGTIPVWSGSGTTLTNSILSQTSSGNAIRLNGIAFFAGTAGSGTGGNYRITDDSGADKWLMGLLGAAGARTWTLYDIVNTQTRVAVDGTSGNVGIGTASPSGRLHVVGGTATSGNGTPLTLIAQSGQASGNTNGGNIVLTPGSPNGSGTPGLVDLSGPSGTGLKLPATPGNADTQTLDAYRENTFTTTTSGATNCSSITLSNLRYTQIGRLVTIEGTASFTVTAATTATSFYFTLPSGCNRGSTANAGAGLAVDNATGYSGALWNLAGTNNDVFLFFNASNPFGAGTSRTVPFSYSYYTASS